MSDRYSRQTVLPEVGAAGQERLRGASVLVVGAGGLGCAVLQYLCAAGVGRLIIIDPDRVEESNLHRQPLYRMSDLGALKVEASRAALLQVNPDVCIETLAERLTPANVSAAVSKAQLIVDAADSFAATYVLSDECHAVGKPLISASVLGLSGYVGAFCGGAPSYRAVFPEMPRQAGSCAQSGVLGTAVGVMGTLQAHMTLALALDLKAAPGLERLPRDAEQASGGPADGAARCAALGQLITVDFRTLRFGGFSFANAQEPAGAAIPFIDPTEVADTDIVIDLRSLTEAPVSPFASALRIGVDTVERAEEQLPQGRRIVLCCRTGVRAWRAARALQRQGHSNVALIALGD
jgi:molybdopterin/thiamine biosynthesis adenylyltransferase/rhodanese-related sulfurtransferase